MARAVDRAVGDCIDQTSGVSAATAEATESARGGLGDDDTCGWHDHASPHGNLGHRHQGRLPGVAAASAPTVSPTVSATISGTTATAVALPPVVPLAARVSLAFSAAGCVLAVSGASGLSGTWLVGGRTLVAARR